WILITNLIVTQDIRPELRNRIKMFGATYISEGAAKIIMTFLMTSLMSILFIYIVTRLSSLYIVGENFFRVFVLIGLYILVLTMILLLIDWLISSSKVALLAKAAVLLAVLLFAGAILPIIYFLLFIDCIFVYSFSYQFLSCIGE